MERPIVEGLTSEAGMDGFSILFIFRQALQRQLVGFQEMRQQIDRRSSQDKVRGFG